ncbi:5372_t:CDS:2, partial [Paraglomus brasilianum]
MSFSLKIEKAYRAIVNLSSTAGDMGILAKHLATIQQLKPGVVGVVENPTTTKKFFSRLSTPLEHFSIEAIRANLAEAQRLSASSTTEQNALLQRLNLRSLKRVDSSNRSGMRLAGFYARFGYGMGPGARKDSSL